MISDSQFKAQSKEEKYPLLFGEEPKVEMYSPSQLVQVNVPQLSPDDSAKEITTSQDQEVLGVLEEILLEVKQTLTPERRALEPRPLSPSLTQQPVEFHSRSVRHHNWIEVIKEPLFSV